jgi:hypothetical protein
MAKNGMTAFIPTEAYRSLKSLVATADARKGIGSAERLVVAVGDTGKGKSWACEAVNAEHGNGIFIHGNEVWKCSYKAVLADVCEAVGLELYHPGRKGRPGREKTAPELRRLLINELRTNRRTLFFEEIDVECLTASLVKLWMTLLNRTLATVVLAINPDALDAIRRMGVSGKTRRAVDEEAARPADIAAQLLRRGRQVPFAEVEAIVPRTLLERAVGKVAALDEAVQMLTDAGTLGGYSLVAEAVEKLAKSAPLTAEAVDSAILTYHGRFKPGKMSRSVTRRPVVATRAKRAA